MIRILTIAGLVWLSAADPAAALTCGQAAASAEATLAIPSGLLLAIGMVESGRADAAGQRSPWPWTVQAGGDGRFFASQPEAVDAVQDLRAGGVQSIDIGCFQINLLHHPDAFTDLAGGFDPLTNATAAAEFLVSLHGEFGGWEPAVAAYHSRTALLGSAYRDRVYAAWSQPSETPHPPPARVAVVFGVHVWGPAGPLNDHASATARRLPRIVTPTWH
jgi:hypothetical protein